MKVWMLAAIIIGAGLLTYCFERSIDADSHSPPTQDVLQQSVATALPVTIEEIEQAYEVNEMAAQQEYGNRQLLVTAMIDAINLNAADEPFVNLRSTGEGLLPVQASFAPAARSATGDLLPGQNVELLCPDLTEMMGSPMLSNCTIIRAGF
jgi:hypothetical protein